MNAKETKAWFGGKTFNAYFALQLLLAYVCLSHLVLGGLAFVSLPEPLAASIIKWNYGAIIDLTPSLVHVIRIVGAYMIAMGVLAGLASMNPSRNRAVIWGIILLLLLRVAQRFIFFNEIQEAFGITTVRLLVQSAHFSAIAIGLLLLLRKASGSGSDPALQSG